MSATTASRRQVAPQVQRSPDGVRRRVRVLLVLSLLGLLFAAPLLVDSFTVVLLMQILVFGLLALSLDFLLGQAGMASLGQAAYFALGAYTAAIIASHVTVSVVVGALAGMVVAGFAALVTGFFTARSHGIFLLMLTLAFGHLVHSAAISWTDVTGGSNGMAGIPRPSLLTEEQGVLGHDAFVYWYLLVVALLTYLAVRRISRSTFGVTLRATQANEERMRSLGHRTVAYRVAAFGLSGAIAGLAGSLSAVMHRFVSPADASFALSILVLVMVIIGGVGSLWGAFVGAAIVVVVQNQIAAFLPGRALLLLGLLFIVMVYVAPRGIAGLVAGRRPRRREEQEVVG